MRALAGDMVAAGGTECVITSGAASGVARADAVCAKSATHELNQPTNTYLPKTHTNHKAMLHRGSSGHPRDIVIPNKAKREVRRPPTSSGTMGVKIAANYNAYWAVGDIDAQIQKSPSLSTFWSGLTTSSGLSGNNCSGWTSGLAGASGGTGFLSVRGGERFGSGSGTCDQQNHIVCTSY